MKKPASKLGKRQVKDPLAEVVSGFPPVSAAMFDRISQLGNQLDAFIENYMDAEIPRDELRTYVMIALTDAATFGAESVLESQRHR